jgi:hypothetical protein
MIARYPTRLIITLSFVMVAIASVLQIASPLRLINDGVDYLLQATSAIDGNGFLLHGVRSMRPPGYPALIWVLAKAGIGTSWAIVALNCLLLDVGCVAGYFVVRDSQISMETAISVTPIELCFEARHLRMAMMSIKMSFTCCGVMSGVPRASEFQIE